jgi:Conjugative transposon, TraM
MENKETKTGIKGRFQSLFIKYKLLFILGGVFVLLLAFYGVSKYVRQEIVKNKTFVLPKIDVSQDNDKNSKKTTAGEMFVAVQQGVEEEKSKDKSTLTMPEKGLKTFQGSKAFSENTLNNSENIESEEPLKVVEKQPLPLLVQVSTTIPSKSNFRHKNRYSKAVAVEAVNQVKRIDNNTFNTTSLENIATIPNQKSKKEFIKAAIYGTQIVRNNSVVRIRLLEAMMMEDEIIPSNTLCNGVAMMGGNRLIIMLTAFKIGADYIPAKMVVYDSNDMLPGIAYLSDNTKGQIYQQNNQTIDNIDGAINSISSAAGVVGQIGAGVVTGISRSLRYGGVQKKAGEIELNEGYKIFLKQN